MFLTGKDGQVVVYPLPGSTDTTNLTAYSWKVTMVAQEEDVTVAYGEEFLDPPNARPAGLGGYGFQEFVTGLIKLTFEVEAYWDTALNPFTAATAMYPGQGACLRLSYDRDVPEASWHIEPVVFTRVEMGTSVRGLTLYSFAGTLAAGHNGAYSPYNPFFTY